MVYSAIPFCIKRIKQKLIKDAAVNYTAINQTPRNRRTYEYQKCNKRTQP